MNSKHPSFADLPLQRDGPHGNAWGLWGPDDQLGTLNHLTDAIIARAAGEGVRSGKRVSLNWSMTGSSYPHLGRKTLELKLTNKAPLKHAHDDEWSFNSQCSSQWDGFRHYAYQKEGVYYMGRTAAQFAESPIPNGIQHIANKGIAGRAVLIDWYSWAVQNGRIIDALSAHPVPFAELLKVLSYQNLSPDDIRHGDILLIRFGYIHQYETLSDDRRSRLDAVYRTQKPENIGIQPSEEVLQFLWEKRIAAIAGDTRSLEVWPCTEPRWHLHEWLLAGWGMPIGELFDLEELSQVCAAEKRYTFFLTSAPMNVPGAVASPPNVLALF
ncbi:hypothetical protein ASPACDRAFT_35545 [Aspergillus aculeatus ATCC 16872]|uniref:Cyclase n=1 Tax=Aspergillus aculeatus (strain ATCC 16872 / CBS 172.66 / WB 5094) TaxID=690307 RepID=A0A1L9WIT0_ASPA1|nr:uncharacterized protein ASPACDRAFT_35545 [Aspergillus aculeatus ATCC 16872]OJJ96063.1 hypothetical protein ASPACDRAFT_35545 [Aspergillus aculeatus ATCC 16872]